jgi:hypothetical protein
MLAVSAFEFHPELFEHRTLALETLEANDYHWFEHFSSVDLLHDLFGLEVCGIIKESDAKGVLAILQEIFPDWPHSDIHYTATSGTAVGRPLFSRSKSEKRDSRRHSAREDQTPE